MQKQKQQPVKANLNISTYFIYTTCWAVKMEEKILGDNKNLAFFVMDSITKAFFLTFCRPRGK